MSSEIVQQEKIGDNGAVDRRVQNVVHERRSSRASDAPAPVKVLGGTRAHEKKRLGMSVAIMWFVFAALVVLAIPVYQGLFYKPGNGWGYFSYWIGIVGSVMMLLMLLYPIRKHLAFARNWGALRYWFMLHMMFGIGGPILVLFHTTFHIKSLNATVSLASMLLVAISGVIGRFIYRHIHQGLYGRQSDLKELQKAVDANQEKISSVLMEAPEIGDKLKKFRDHVMAKDGSLPSRMWRFMTMTWYRRKLTSHCSDELRKAVIILAKSQHWNARQQEMHWQEAVNKVSSYLEAAQQAGQFSTYERLFRLWHILHSPFVWLLGFSAIVHVVAVNMY
ncbi:MAG: hypothetical protein HOO95_02655 [Gallionella sp.]|nr:hypothetical protein [Gallionella sp.]